MSFILHCHYFIFLHTELTIHPSGHDPYLSKSPWTFIAFFCSFSSMGNFITFQVPSLRVLSTQEKKSVLNNLHVRSQSVHYFDMSDYICPQLPRLLTPNPSQSTRSSAMPYLLTLNPDSNIQCWVVNNSFPLNSRNQVHLSMAWG